MYPPQGGYPPPPGQQPPHGQPYGQPQGAQKDPVQATATRALIISVIAIPLCCAPVGVVGAVFGVKAMKMAKERGSPSPGRAVAAVILGGLSVVIMVATIVAFLVDQSARDARLAAADQATKGKLEDDTLDKKTACALVEKQLHKGLYEEKTLVDDVRCKGSWETSADRGELRDIEADLGADKVKITACLARSRRWFVLSLAQVGEACPTGKLPAAKTGKATDEELEAEEDELRKTEKARVDQSAVDGFVASLAKIRTALDGIDANEKPCKLDVTKWTHGDATSLVVPSVDFERLGEKHAKTEDWSFLTTEQVIQVMDGAKPIADRARMLRELRAEAGPFLIVYAGADRAWPQEAEKKLFEKKKFASGGFDGHMVVVDTRDAKVLCMSSFAFENSASVKVGKFGSVTNALRDDLKHNYEAAAGAKLRALAAGKLRLSFMSAD